VNISNASLENNSLDNSTDQPTEKKKKKFNKQTFKNFFKKLNIETKKSKKESKQMDIGDSMPEINKIFDIGKKIVSILNKIQILDFFFSRICEMKVVTHEENNKLVRLDIKRFLNELEQQLYGVIEKIVDYYRVKVTEIDVSSKNFTFTMPSIETCGLLNILGNLIDLISN
jgi:flagellar hook-basal body complex protein FliE